MKAHAMLNMLASRYATGAGPVRRQLDAQTLLRMTPHLDEESSRIYLERFVSKWRVDLTVVDGEQQEYDRAVEGVARGARNPGLIRRRPMTDLERKVQEELSLEPRDLPVRQLAEAIPHEPGPREAHEEEASEPSSPLVTVTFEDAQGNVHTL